VPCILVECGYLTNADEDLKLNDPEYQQKLASGMVEGICDYFGRNE
jgi:N-acetylmuramoyl-L-alanine amidase